jgi:hypothetical protein
MIFFNTYDVYDAAYNDFRLASILFANFLLLVQKKIGKKKTTAKSNCIGLKVRLNFVLRFHFRLNRNQLFD